MYGNPAAALVQSDGMAPDPRVRDHGGKVLRRGGGENTGDRAGEKKIRQTAGGFGSDRAEYSRSISRSFIKGEKTDEETN